MYVYMRTKYCFRILGLLAFSQRKGTSVYTYTRTYVRTCGDMNTTILGFRDNPLIGPNDGTDIVREADSVVDMSRGFESLYVYTNVVEPRVVGDSLVPLLRIVPLSGMQGDTVSKTFQKTQYVPVLCKEFGTIEIDTSRSVPFERGKVVVTLHFRRIKSRLL